MGKALIYNDKFEKKHIFSKKSTKKRFLNILAKKSIDDEKTHKKAHVLLKSTPYKA